MKEQKLIKKLKITKEYDITIRISTENDLCYTYECNRTYMDSEDISDESLKHFYIELLREEIFIYEESL